MLSFREDLENRLKDDEFRAEYEALEPEMEIIRMMIKARKEQSITQKMLSESTGIHQTDISKIETGRRSPSLDTLRRLANGLGYKVKLQFVPIE